MKTIAFFDFDGTITNKDTLLDFVRYAVGIKKFVVGLVVLSPILVALKLKLIPNYAAKEKFISYFFKGDEFADFLAIAANYSATKIDAIVREKAVEQISWHQSRGHKVVVVSASMDSWLEQWCIRHNLDLISTQLEVEGGVITGRFKTRNCHGAEKVSRIKEKYDLSEYSEIYAYGDSGGDTEMLALAHKSQYKPFRN